jgi:hypothetical protein
MHVFEVKVFMNKLSMCNFEVKSNMLNKNYIWEA